MSGRYVKQIEIRTEVEKALKEIGQVQSKVNNLKNTKYDLDIGVPTEKIEKVVSTIEKMFSSIKVNNNNDDYKQFETLSKELRNVISMVEDLNVFLNTIDNSKTESLIKSVRKLKESICSLNEELRIGNSTSYSVSSKSEAYQQLKKTSEIYKQFFKENKSQNTKAGTEAAFSYFRSYIEAVKQGVNENRLEKYTIGYIDEDLKYPYDEMKKRIKDISSFKYNGDLDNDFMTMFSNIEMKLSDFDATYAKVKQHLGEAPITPNITSNIEEYVNLLENIRDREHDLSVGLDINESLLQLDKDIANDRLSEIIKEAIVTNKEYEQSLNETQKKNVENQTKLQEELKETEQVVKQTQEGLDKVNSNSSSNNTTNQIVENEKKKQEAYKATTDVVMYHAGVISKLNKAETNGQFYESSRSTGFFGTGHYFVDSATKHELDSNSSFSSRPYTSIDISKYDNLFKATTDEIADKLHTFLKRLTRFTQGSEDFNTAELFSQFKEVFTDTTMDMREFDAKLEELKSYMQNSSMNDYGDSVSTQFMKSLGYGGVDTRGTRYADVRYGTVIYDLKEESVLQANITDELQKQGQMLEKINYEKGQVFDSSEDARIQKIIDLENKNKEISSEYAKIYDDSKLDSYYTELNSINEQISNNLSLLNDYRSKMNTVKEDTRQLFEDRYGKDIPEDKLSELVSRKTLDYQQSINELEKEIPLLRKREEELEENIKVEENLSNAAYQRAKEIVEERHQQSASVSQNNSDSSSIVIEKEIDGLKQETIAIEEVTQAKEKLAESNDKISNSSNENKSDFSEEIKNYDEIAKKASNAAKELVKARDVIRQVEIRRMEYDDDGNVIGQVPDKFSFSERLSDGKIETTIARWNNVTEQWDTNVTSVRTAFEEVGKEVINLDNKISQYEIKRDKALVQHPTYDTTADNELISLAEKRREVLLDTLSLYSQSEDYEYENTVFEERRLENQERLNALKKISNSLVQAKNDEISLKSEQKRLDNVIKTNRALNKQRILVDSIEKTYNKNINSGLDKSVTNPEDLDQLAKIKEQIEGILTKLNDQGRNSTNENEFQKLEKLIAEYKELAKYKLKANNPSEQKLGGTNLEVAIKTQIAQYDKLIIKAEKYGNETSEIVTNLKKQKDLLTATDEKGVSLATSNDYINARDDYKIAKSQIDIIETKARSAYNEIKNLISEYSSIEKRLANGEGIKSDIARSAELNEKLIELQSVEILSTSQIEDTKRKLNDLEASIDKIYIKQENKNTSKQEINSLEIEKFSNKLETSKQKMNELNLVSDEMKTKFNEVQERFGEFSNKLNNDEISLRKYKHEMNNLISTFNDYVSVEKKVQSGNANKRRKSDVELGREVYDELIAKINRYKKVTTRIAKGDNVYESDKKEAEELLKTIEKLQTSKYLTQKQLNKSNSILNDHFDYTISDIENEKAKKDNDKRLATQKEIIEFNKKVTSELEKTENRLLSLEVPKNLRGDFNKLFDDIENLNDKLKENELSFSKYSTTVESKLRKFNSLVKKVKKENEKAFTTALSNKEKGDHNYWQGRFFESIKDLSGEIKNPTLDNMKKYYQELEKQADSSYKKLEEENKKRQSSVNSALNEQIKALKKIESIRFKIAKADPENKEYISQLQESKKLYQKQYLQANKTLKVNQDLYDVEDHINKLKQISLETTAEITKYENKNKALLETQEKLNSLPQNSKFVTQFEEAKSKVEALNKELTTTNLSVKNYNKAVDSILQNYSNLIKNDSLVENQKAYQKLIDIIERYSDVTKRIAKGNAYENDETKAKVLLNIIKSLQKQPILSDTQLENADKKLKLLATDLEDIKKKTANDTLNTVKSSIEKFQKALNNLRFAPSDFHSFDEWKTQLNIIEYKINELKALNDNVRIVDGIVNADDIKEIDYLSDEISNLITQAKKVPQIERGWKELNATNVAEKINKLYEDNTRMSRKAREEVLGWYNAIRSGNVTKPLNEILNIVEKIVQEERAAGRAGKSFFDIFKTKAFYGFIGQIQSYLSMYVGFYGMMNKVRTAITTIIELDEALVDLQKTTTMTNSQLNEFYYESSDIAKQMGVTTQEIIEQASAWSRLNKIGLLYGDI